MSRTKCEACSSSMAKLEPDKCREYLKDLPEWQLDEGSTEISRKFSFQNFVSALEFANEVGRLCEEMGHHPVLTVGWGFCRVRFKTSKIGGLHANDFIMAKEVDKLQSGQK
ncbi:MAG: 4a-hydroxytetrahydrobiopterin dehydratase [Candidatus Rifleibacteriota bacterium]